MTRSKNTEVEQAFTSYKVPDRKCWSVRCNWCQKELAQHTGRQLGHLRLCPPYQRHLREQGITPAEARQVQRPGPLRTDQTAGDRLVSPPPDDDVSIVVTKNRLRSGGCRYPIKSGDNISVGCPCFAGSFDIPDTIYPGSRVDIRCQNCSHLVGNHAVFQEDEQVNNKENMMKALGALPPHVTLRKKTVKVLWEELRQFRAMYIRGVPGSGKSTLAALLASWIAEDSNFGTEVITISCPENISLPIHSHATTVLRELGVPELFLSSSSPRVILLDEAQNVAVFHNFWNDFMKAQTAGAIPGLYVALFSAYGAPGESPISHVGLESVKFGQQQLVSVRSLPGMNNSKLALYFTRDEFDDVLERVCVPGNYKTLTLSEAVKNFLWVFTGGHPGCVRALLNALREASEFTKFVETGTPIPLPPLISFLRNSEAFTSSIDIKTLTSFNKPLESPSVEDALMLVLANHQLPAANPDDNSLLESIHKRGLLHAETDPASGEIVYIFPSLMHRRIYEAILNRKSMFPGDQEAGNFVRVEAFMKDSFKRFSRGALRREGMLGPGSVVRGAEVKFADEMYRSCWETAEKKSVVTSLCLGAAKDEEAELWVPEVGLGVGVWKGGGGAEEEVDKGEGKDLKGGGQAEGEDEKAGEQKDENTPENILWIDFRTDKPEVRGGESAEVKEERRREGRKWTVVFGEEFKTAEVLDSAGENVLGPFELME